MQRGGDVVVKDPEVPSPGVRLDLWLWAARFFRTRSLAREAIEGGKVQVNNAAAKPSRLVRAGDVLQVRRAEELYAVVVQGVSDTRGPAPVAQALYAETEASAAARAAAREARRLSPPPAPREKPDKKDRRELRKLAATPGDGLPPWWPR